MSDTIGKLKINRPSTSEVNRYLKRWDEMENYVLQESSLRKLFTETYPRNSSMDDVLIKVCSLNDFYSTNIFSPFMVAKHIVSLNIDKRLAKEDISLVNDMAAVEVAPGNKKRFYSFASKYCSHHKPTVFPIFDSYVFKLLLYVRKNENFYDFQPDDLKDYCKYRDILLAFRKYFGLEKYTLKDLDRYLWQAGKKYFPNKYN